MSAVAVIAATGCGSDDDGGGTPAPAAATNASTPAETTTTAATTTTTAAAGDASPTPLGSTLEFGQAAVVAYDDTIHHHKSAVRITPHAIEQGTIGDFKNIKLDAGQKTSTPYYVKVDVANVGKGDLSDSSPGSYLNGVDDRDQNQNEVIFFGDFEQCESKIPKSLKPGESYKTCLTYLIPKGGSLKGMRWIAFDKKTGKSDLNWK